MEGKDCGIDCGGLGWRSAGERGGLTSRLLLHASRLFRYVKANKISFVTSDRRSFDDQPFQGSLILDFSFRLQFYNILIHILLTVQVRYQVCGTYFDTFTRSGGDRVCLCHVVSGAMFFPGRACTTAVQTTRQGLKSVTLPTIQTLVDESLRLLAAENVREIYASVEGD
jgi:hypothetical protein